MTDTSTEKNHQPNKSKHSNRRKKQNRRGSNNASKTTTEHAQTTENPKKNSNHSQQKNQRRNNQQKNKSYDNANRSRRHSNQKKGRSKWNRYRISDHFMKRDFDSRKDDCECQSSLRISLGLVGVIESIRARLNKRIEIITGYYCPTCRSRQYGVKRDFHTMGVAADIRVEGMDPTDLFQLAETYPELKGIGLNLDDGHVHIDTRKSDERECWVEHNNNWILLTNDNRSDYFPNNANSYDPAESVINARALPDSKKEPLELPSLSESSEPDHSNPPAESNSHSDAD